MDGAGRVVSVNEGTPRVTEWHGRLVESGIWKEPVDGRVAVRGVNVDGDGQADLRVHGGPDKAVYAYPVQHYCHWAGELGRDLSPFGYFGENLTVEGLDEAGVLIGDVLRAGGALLEVSHPRVPCGKLAMRMQDHAFGKPFLASGRVGFYMRVLEEGELGAGDAIELVRRGEGGFSVRRIAWMRNEATAGDLEAAAALPALAAGWREGFTDRMAAMRRRGATAG